MPLNPEIKRVLEAMPPSSSLEVDHLPLPQALQTLRSRPLMPLPVDNPVHTTNRIIPNEAHNIPIRIYSPPGDGPFGIVVNFHGGGWVLGSLDQDEYLCQLLAKAGFIIVSVDYRLAPEAPFPKPFDDCYTATRWVSEHAAELNGVPDRIAVAGSSAGGNLAAAVALKARDTGEFRVAYQLLIYPVCDGRMALPSHVENASGYHLTHRSMLWFWNQYAPDLTAREHPYASPLRAESLSGLPPAQIIAAELDPLRDEAEAYASRLRDAGVAVSYVCFDGLIHGFFRMVPGAPWVKAIIDRGAKGLHDAFRM